MYKWLQRRVQSPRPSFFKGTSRSIYPRSGGEVKPCGSFSFSLVARFLSSTLLPFFILGSPCSNRILGKGYPYYLGLPQEPDLSQTTETANFQNVLPSWSPTNASAPRTQRQHRSVVSVPYAGVVLVTLNPIGPTLNPKPQTPNP